jgi:hypothetical protein
MPPPALEALPCPLLLELLLFAVPLAEFCCCCGKGIVGTKGFEKGLGDEAGTGCAFSVTPRWISPSEGTLSLAVGRDEHSQQESQVNNQILLNGNWSRDHAWLVCSAKVTDRIMCHGLAWHHAHSEAFSCCMHSRQPSLPTCCPPPPHTHLACPSS